MDPKGLFRQAALEKLSSPERLDETMRVTAPATWLAVIALATMLVVLILWSFFGTMSVKVQGTGMLQSSGGIVPITAAAQGRVLELKVQLDDEVRTNDIIGKLDLGSVRVLLENERTLLARLESQRPGADRQDQTAITGLNRQLADLRKDYAAKKRLLDVGGNVTAEAVVNAAQTILRVQDQIDAKKKAIEERRRSIEESRGTIRKLTEQLSSGGELRSPCAGRIIEIAERTGSMLQPGDQIAKVEKTGELTGIVFIPTADGKRVKGGFRGQVSPSTVKKEEWGFINGRVQSVSEYPASAERLKLVLGNDQLVDEVTKQSASSMEITIRLVKDPTSPSRLSWSSGIGPNQKIYSGTKCTGNVTVEKRRPISYVLRYVHKVLRV